MAETNPEGLIRGIRRWDLVAVAVNAVIGAGIFGLPSRVYALLGPYSVLAFAACAVVVTVIVLCFAEVASRYTETGGPYLYAREAFGPLAGFEVGWLVWVARVTGFAANCNLLVGYLGFFWPGAGSGVLRSTVITVVVLVMTLINVVGVRDVARASNIFTVGKLAPLALFVAAGVFFIDPGTLSLGRIPRYGAFSTSVLLLVYAFTGFEMAAIPAGEVRDPRRNLPMAIFAAIGISALLYTGIQIVCIGTLPELAASERPLADAAARFLGRAGAALISAGAIVSVLGNLNVVLLSASRLPFAMAARHELPHIFATTHSRFRTPHTAILGTAAVMLVLTISGSFIYAVTVSAIARLVAYGATAAALPVLRRKQGAPEASFRLRGGVLLSTAALLLSVWLLSNATVHEARDTAVAALLGIVIYICCTMAARSREY